MAFDDNLKGVRDYIVTAIKGVWGNTSHEPPEMVNSLPFTLVTTSGVSMEPETLGASDEALVTYTIGGAFAKVGNLDDAKITKFHQARDALLADPHANDNCTELRVVSCDFTDQDPKDNRYEVVMVVEARISADRP